MAIDAVGSTLQAEVSYAVAAKIFKAAKQQGDAAITLLDATTRLQRELLSQDPEVGQILDVVG